MIVSVRLSKHDVGGEPGCDRAGTGFEGRAKSRRIPMARIRYRDQLQNTEAT